MKLHSKFKDNSKSDDLNSTVKHDSPGSRDILNQSNRQ